MSEFQQEFRLLQSSRGGYKLAENGFLYDKQRKVGDIIHWQCEQRSICKARLFTKHSEIVRRSNDHIHEADENRISCYETKTRIKRKAESTQDSTHQILTQNVWRKVQGVGLQARYSQDAELAIRIRLLPALAFAAPDEVPQLFALVAEQLPITEARDLILYFENTYIGRVLPGGGIQAPLFPISMWNYYLETPFGLPRTNNQLLSKQHNDQYIF